MTFWGSFRLGKILIKFSAQFDKNSSLLRSDLSLNEDGSIAFWLRQPKVWTNDLGSYVEVWPVPQRPELDPVSTIKRFLSLRH